MLANEIRRMWLSSPVISGCMSQRYFSSVNKFSNALIYGNTALVSIITSFTYKVYCRIIPQNNSSGRSSHRPIVVPSGLRGIRGRVPLPSGSSPRRHPLFQSHRDAPMLRRLNLKSKYLITNELIFM